MASSTRTTVTVRFNNILAVRAAIIAAVHSVVDQSAANIETRAKQMAPVDTSSLQQSIYKNNGTDSDYTENTARARAVNKEVVILDEIDPEFVISLSSDKTDQYMQVVGVAASHGIFQEFGTRHMRAQPFLLPSALGEESNFSTAMTRIAG